MSFITDILYKKHEPKLVACELDIHTIYDVHHKLSPVINALYIDASNLDVLTSFIGRFGQDYKLILELPKMFQVWNAYGDAYALEDYFKVLEQHKSNIHAAIVTLSTYECDDTKLDFMVQSVFMSRVLPWFDRNGIKLYLRNGKFGVGKTFSFGSMFMMHSIEKRIHLAIDLVKADKYLAVYDTLTKYNSLAGFGKRFEMVFVSGMDVDGNEVPMLSPKDAYNKEFYLKLMSRFPKGTLFVYRGSVEVVLNSIKVLHGN